MNNSEKLPTLYLPHWWWPWNLMDENAFDKEWYSKLTNYLKSVWERYEKDIKSILIISAHWEEENPTIYSTDKSKLFYDYYCFPNNTYNVDYNIIWDNSLSEKIELLLTDNWFDVDVNHTRWYDHWTFIPLMVAFPDIKAPVIQLSLMNWLDAKNHIKLWNALEKLRSEWVLIIGSWMSYHNINWLLSNNQENYSISKQFNQWLTEILIINDNERRINALINWKNIPWSNECHPRSEHLTPLFVIAWAWWIDTWKLDYSETLMNVNITSYKFW